MIFTTIDSLEIDFIDDELRLEDAGSEHSAAQDVLFRRRVVGQLYHVHFVQETEQEIKT